MGAQSNFSGLHCKPAPNDWPKVKRLVRSRHIHSALPNRPPRPNVLHLQGLRYTNFEKLKKATSLDEAF